MYYAITIKKTRGTPDRSDYEGYMATMFQKNPGLVDCGSYYEYTKGLHIHGLLFKRGAFGYSDAINSENQRGWSIRVRPVYNLAGWKQYIKKDLDKPTDIKRSEAGVVDHQRAEKRVSGDDVKVPLSMEMEEEDNPSVIYRQYGRII